MKKELMKAIAKRIKNELLNDLSLSRGTGRGLTNHGMWLVGLCDVLIRGEIPRIDREDMGTIPGSLCALCEIVED
jgi:hypothetical protein